MLGYFFSVSGAVEEGVGLKKGVGDHRKLLDRTQRTYRIVDGHRCDRRARPPNVSSACPIVALQRTYMIST